MKGAYLMLPEERERQRIDKQLNNAGWNIVARDEYMPNDTSAVKEALMQSIPKVGMGFGLIILFL